MSTEWIRSNMLTNGKCDRKLTEAELKVQRALQRLSIPDWYLNKHRSPPKLLNTKPFEFRPSPWKNSSKNSLRDCTLNSPSSSLSDIEKSLNEKAENIASPGTTPIKKNTCHQQKLSVTGRKRRLYQKEIFDIDIPIAKYPKKISKTFPKMLPSRKIANINLVLPPGPKIAFSKEFKSIYLDDGSDNMKKLKNLRQNLEQKDVTEEKENVFPKLPTTSVKLADKFNIRATSTPKFSRVIKDVEKKRVLCDLAKQNFSTSEDDSMDRAMNLLNTSKNILKSRRLSPNILEKVSIFESNSSVNSFDQSYTRTSSNKLLLENNIRSIDSVRAKASIFENNSTTDNFNRSHIKSSSNKEKLSTTDIRPVELVRKKDVREKDVREKTFIFESNSSIDSFDQNNAGTSSNKLLLRRNVGSIQSVRAKVNIFESNSSMSSFDQTYIKPSSNKEKRRLSTKNHIQSIDSAREDSSSKNSFDQSYAGTLSERSNIRSDNSRQNDLIRPIGHPSFRQLKTKQIKDPSSPRKEAVRNEAPRLDAVKSSINSVKEKILNVDQKLPNIHSSSREKKNSDRQWSYKEFLGSEKKPMESSASKSKQPNRKENMIQKIIRIFNEKVEISESRHGKSSDLHQNFVKQLVKALERGDISAMKKMTHRDKEEGSCNESETKSYVTSTFFQDTDISSDYNQGSSFTEKCDKQRYDTKSSLTTGMENLTVKIEKKIEEEEDDSVYWIPISVPMLKLPRSSSLLSVISKLSSNDYSPCISPIIGEDEEEFSQQATCETTFKQNAAKRLFKIDETVVIDSGYSDKSERSVLNSVPSVADNTWYDDTFSDFQTERKSQRRKWSPKPVSIAGYTYHVQ